MVAVEHSVVIERSFAEVSAFLRDRANDGLWRSRRDRPYELPEAEGRLTLRAASGLIRPEGSFELTPAGGGTRVMLRLTCEPRRVLRLWTRSAVRSMRLQIEALDRLKCALEREAEHDTDDEPVPLSNTFLRAFAPREFVRWPSWNRLQRLLSSNGGCYGLYGPRGAGKTWHLRNAVHRARERDGIGVWYPSPSEYDSSAFLLALTETLSGEIQARWRKMHPGRTLPTDSPTGQRILLSGMLGLFVAASASFVAIGNSSTLNSSTLPLAAGGLAGLTMFTFFDAARRKVLSRTADASLLLEAKRLKEAVRFSLNRRESLEVGGQAGRGVMGKVMSREERELNERPLTLSTLIQDFRGLAQQAGEVVDPEPVVIAIDELDKMSDYERVRQLLRDIKGIFDIPNVYFLVSVSSEAARALNLNGLAERNEFNSSFEDVVEMPPLNVDSCRELLKERIRTDRPELASALAVMSGGIPRELVRLAEHVLRDGMCDDAGRREAIAAAIGLEALELRGLVVSASDDHAAGPVGQPAKTGVFALLATTSFSPDTFPEFAETALEHWSPPWANDAWSARFEEGWRRLLVRIHVAGILARSDGPVLLESAQPLQDIVVHSAQSATVAALQIKAMEPGAADAIAAGLASNGVSRRRLLPGRRNAMTPNVNGEPNGSRGFSGGVYFNWGSDTAARSVHAG
jgi:KAP-like P-loop domain-containing protein